MMPSVKERRDKFRSECNDAWNSGKVLKAVDIKNFKVKAVVTHVNLVGKMTILVIGGIMYTVLFEDSGAVWHYASQSVRVPYD